MKNKLILVTILISLSTLIVFGAVEVDLRKGVDLTATNVVSYSILNQLVDNGTIWNSGQITNGRGIVMRSTIRPHVTHNPRYTNFLWLDLSLGMPGTLRQYVCCGDADANWVVAALGIGSVTSTNILDYTIQAIDMATNSVSNYAIQDNAIDANKIQAQAVVAGKIGPSAVSNLNIAASTIDGGRIALNTISNANIYDFTLFSNKIGVAGIAAFNLAPGAVSSDNIGPFSIVGTNLQNNTITNEQIANNAISSNKIAAGQVDLVRLNTNVTIGLAKAWGFFDSSGLMLKGYNLVGGANFNTGDYSVHFTNNFAPTTTNYIMQGSALSVGASANITFYSNMTTFVALKIQNEAGTEVDRPFMVIFYDFP